MLLTRVELGWREGCVEWPMRMVGPDLDGFVLVLIESSGSDSSLPENDVLPASPWGMHLELRLGLE